jgi:hypothetical protein
MADAFDPVRIGIVSVSDRASTGVYEDKGLPALKDWLTRALKNPITFDERLIPDEQQGISAALIELVDAGCSLVLTTRPRWPWRTRRCRALASRCARSACASCRRPSCRANAQSSVTKVSS